MWTRPSNCHTGPRHPRRPLRRGLTHDRTRSRVRTSRKTPCINRGIHTWMRDYDPTTGRYMQADPLGLVDGASVYGYALQNPGRYTDPRGEQSTTHIYPGEVGSDLIPEYPQSGAATGASSGLSLSARILSLTGGLMLTPSTMGNGEALPNSCGVDQCLEHYKACSMSRLGGFSGSVYGESRCQSCYNVCRGSGVWPNSIPSAANGRLICRYWSRTGR